MDNFFLEISDNYFQRLHPRLGQMAVLKKDPLTLLFGDGYKFFSLDTLTLTK